MFGHVLQMPEDIPALRALEIAVLCANQYRASKGSHRTNQLRVLRSDLKEVGQRTTKSKNLTELKTLAEEKTQWSKAKMDRLQL